MIITVAELRKASERWQSAGKDPKLFDTAINALNSATTNVDVWTALRSPTFSVKMPDDAGAIQPGIWRIYVNGDRMLDYQLQEGPADADVTIIP
jgi:hypothetical protein